jgi:hypothetical protein
LLFKLQITSFSSLRKKYVAYQNTWGFRCKELMAENPFTFIADNFSTFTAGNRFFQLLADSGKWHITTNFSDLLRETYSRYWFNSGKPISAIS